MTKTTAFLLAFCATGIAQEWAGTFDLVKHTPYTWIASSKDGAYGGGGDLSMKILILETDENGAHGIEHMEAAAKDKFANATATDITIRTDTELGAGVLYNLKFDPETFISTYKIHLEKTAPYAIFCEHVPIEFEIDYHYLLKKDKSAVEPVAEELFGGEDGHDHGGHDGHDHGGETATYTTTDTSYEWVGIFTLGKHVPYTWIASHYNTPGTDPHAGHDHGRMLAGHDGHDHGAGAYTGDSSMKILIMDLDAPDSQSDTAIKALFKGAAKDMPTGKEMGEAGVLYNLKFDTERFMSIWKIHMEKTASYVIFCEHVPTEFEIDFHYLKGSDGTDIEPTAQGATAAAAVSAMPEVSTGPVTVTYEWAGVFSLGKHVPYTWIASHYNKPAAADPHAGHDHGGGHEGHDHGRMLVADAHAGHDHGGGHEGHDHGGGDGGGSGGGCYAGDSSMKILIMETEDTDAHGIEHVEAAAKVLFNGTAKDMPTGTEMGEAGVLYNLKFDTERFMSIWKIHMEKTASYVIFCEHVPTEFEIDFHYLKGSDGTDIEPSATETVGGHDGHDHGGAEGAKNSLGIAFVASTMTAMCAFIGVLTLAPTLKKVMQPSYAFAIASGVLLACALMLMWPESLIFINYSEEMGMDEATGEKPKEAHVAAVFAVMVLLGFITSPILRWAMFMIFGADGEHGSQIKVEPGPGSAEGKLEAADGAVAVPAKAQAVDWGLVLSMAFGDGFHNICDGVVIGVAFKGCDAATAWAVAGGAIWHELAQELGDFLVFTTAGGLSVKAALGINFLSALSCILATLIVWELELGNFATGCFLAYSGGTYTYLGTVSTFAQLPKTQWALHALLFVLGTVSIGLVLIKHEHCSAGGGHEGHNH